METRPEHAARHTERDHVRLAVRRKARVLMRATRQSGQVMVIVAVWIVALVGSAALILLTGSVEGQRNQLPQLAAQSAPDAGMKVGVSCKNAKAAPATTPAANFLATQGPPPGALPAGAG